MSITGYRRPLTIAAAVVALLSFAAVGGVMAVAATGGAAPVWMTSFALYGLPLAFLALLFLVADAVFQRRRK
jgi:hypothetical protein